MTKQMNNPFLIFGHLGLGDHIVCCGLYRHWAINVYPDRPIIIPVWEHNLAAIQWLLSGPDCKNVYFYPVETEQQLLTCRDQTRIENGLCLGFYDSSCDSNFNPVLWDSEFYRQAGLPVELSYTGFRLPDFGNVKFNLHGYGMPTERQMTSKITYHHDPARGFVIKDIDPKGVILNPQYTISQSCFILNSSEEIHVIDSSMLCLADRLETPYCKRFVFHRYARKGLPPKLRKPWEIIE